jgi:uncharacterized repeat protein (TIGR03837 family)
MRRIVDNPAKPLAQASDKRPDTMLWDVFCRVVDNYGDAGVCWRLCADLAARGERVRLWMDEPALLAWMAPAGKAGVEVARWHEKTQWPPPGDIVVEAFGCRLAPEFIAAMADLERSAGQNICWINLEYLSAEPFVERSHGLPSPLLSGAGAGLVKYFFFPGFTLSTGGLLREPGLAERQHRFDRASWLAQHDIDADGELLVSLFCYEPPRLADWLAQLARGTGKLRLLVAAGRSAAAVAAALEQQNRVQPHWNESARLAVTFLPFLAQVEYDHLLWACDLNFVRGEDSWIRAIWAGKPFIWQPYPQDDEAHHAKLEAFLALSGGPADWQAFHRAWCGTGGAALPPDRLPAWKAAATDLRAGLLAQSDLTSRLLAFVAKKR